MKAYPPFYLQLVDGSGTIVRVKCGPKEALLIDAVVAKVLSKGVGLFHTEADVEQKLRAALEEVVADLKVKNPFDVIE